eukprot:768531-Hanusia_phi.AAC.3
MQVPVLQPELSKSDVKGGKTGSGRGAPGGREGGDRQSGIGFQGLVDDAECEQLALGEPWKTFH